MAQYHARIKGGRGEATRCGTKVSGMYGHIKGWDLGCEVMLTYDRIMKRDHISVYITSGTNARKPSLCVYSGHVVPEPKKKRVHKLRQAIDQQVQQLGGE